MIYREQCLRTTLRSCQVKDSELMKYTLMSRRKTISVASSFDLYSCSGNIKLILNYNINVRKRQLNILILVGITIKLQAFTFSKSNQLKSLDKFPTEIFSRNYQPFPLRIG